MAKKPAEPLKIGLILDASLDTDDGVQQYVMAVGEWLRAQGHDVHYLVGQTNTRQLQNIHSLSRNVSVSFNGNRTTIPLPTGRRKLSRFIKQQNFDVLHVQTPHHPLMAQHLIMAASDRTAVVGTFHIAPYGRFSVIGNRGLGLWLRPSLKRFDQMVSVSEAAARFAKTSFGMDTSILPNVINYKRFNSAKPLPVYNDNKLTILFLGRLVQRKGCQVLLEAVALLAKETGLPDFRLIICGKGYLEPDLKKFVARHGLEDRVTLTGFVEEKLKPRYYATADIAVFPSSGGESFGIVLLEAMASGQTAVLAGDNPGYRSVLAPHPELLFKPRDVSALAQKLRLYLTHSELREAAAAWGSQYAMGFDTSIIGQRLLEIYYEALRKRRLP